MRRIALAAVLLPLAACSFAHGDDDKPGVAASGTGTARSFAAADFSKVSLAGPDDAEVALGSTFSVRAEGPAAELDTVRVVREGDQLVLRRKRGNDGSHDKVHFFVTLPQLRGATVAGSGTMTVARVAGGDFDASLAGSGTLDLRAVAVERAEFSVAGSGDVRAAGTAKRLAVNIAGSGSIEAPGLRASGAEVSIAGSGGVRATVAGDAEVNIMGSGDVDLGAQARCKTNKMGSGSVRCGG